MSPRRITVGDIIAEHGRSYPGGLALVDGERRLTWPELDERVNRLANALRGTGVGPGMRILWLGQNSFRVYELLGAAAKLGAMVCPGYWRWAPPEMAFAIEDFSPKVVIWQEEEIGSTVRAARALAGPAAESALWLRHDAGPGHGYEAFLAGGDPADPGLDVDPDSALLVIYTAAISGRPGRLDAVARQPDRHGHVGGLAGRHRRRDGVPELRADVPHRQLPVLRHPGADPGRHQRRHAPGHRQRGAGHPGRTEMHPRVPHAGHRHPADRADAGARRRTAALQGHHRRPAVAGHGGGGRQPPRPRRRRHGLRLRADRGHRLLPVRRVRRTGRGQRRPARAGHLGPHPRLRRPGVPHRRGRRDLRPRRHRAPGLLEPAGDQRTSGSAAAGGTPPTWAGASRTARSPSSAR